MHGSSYHEMKNNIEKYLSKYSHRSIKVAEIGSLDVNGTYKTLMEDSWTYIGLDICNGKNVDILMTNPDIIPLEDCSMDVVISGQCLEHCKRPWILMREIGRITKPGGVCLITAPAKFCLHDYPSDYWRFYPEGMKILLEDSGFTNIITYTVPHNALTEKNFLYFEYVDCWGIGTKI
jgi:SAM-dependent methyltransferase